jgi:hypothetical protein
MGRVLRTEALPWPDLLWPVLVCVVLAVAALIYVAGMLRQAAAK